MKVLIINVVCGIRSTGRLCTDLATALEKQNHEVKIAYGRETVPEQYQKYAVRIGTEMDVVLHGLKARLLDAAGFGSRKATIKFIEWVKTYDPDIIHLHNIHGYYINIEILFDYLKVFGKKIIWTLHDCWAFTGHSANCDAIKCERWMNGCYQCPQINVYPKSWINRSKSNWLKKRTLFTNIPQMTIVCPSKWLAGLVKSSILVDYPLKVIYNGVDTHTFKPSESTLREKYRLLDKKIILGVAAVWGKRKGLEDFIELRKRLNEEYSIILIGLSKKQIRMLPQGFIGITRTDSTQSLAAFYTMADVFVNPTYEDNYPTTNLEAIACGTPVITYNTGGSPESAEIYGLTVEKGNVEALTKAVKNILHPERKDINIDKNNMVFQYVSLYEEEE